MYIFPSFFYHNFCIYTGHFMRNFTRILLTTYLAVPGKQLKFLFHYRAPPSLSWRYQVPSSGFLDFTLDSHTFCLVYVTIVILTYLLARLPISYPGSIEATPWLALLRLFPTHLFLFYVIFFAWLPVLEIGLPLLFFLRLQCPRLATFFPSICSYSSYHCLGFSLVFLHFSVYSPYPPDKKKLNHHSLYFGLDDRCVKCDKNQLWTVSVSAFFSPRLFADPNRVIKK